MRWKMPKNAHYSHYCCHCKHWEFVKDEGCSHIGKCKAVDGKEYEQDAYDAPCGLWEEKHENRQTNRR